MGEVTKSTDTRLARTVAVKVLPERVASDPELKQRFELEAKTLAALSHPHICPVFDVGSHNGIDFLVMEYLEGETLEQRLKKGALPLDQVLQLAIQTADALAAAHRAGIIHRDCKPGNVMLTKSGARLSISVLRKPVLRPWLVVCRCCPRRRRISPYKARCSVRFSTWRQSKSRVRRQTRARISLRSAPCSTRP